MSLSYVHIFITRPKRQEIAACIENLLLTKENKTEEEEETDRQTERTKERKREEAPAICCTCQSIKEKEKEIMELCVIRAKLMWTALVCV